GVPRSTATGRREARSCRLWMSRRRRPRKRRPNPPEPDQWRLNSSSIARQLAALETEHDQKRDDEGNDEVEKPEDEQGGKHIGPVHFGKAGDERDFQHAKSARRMRKKRERKRNHENAEHDEEPGIA